MTDRMKDSGVAWIGEIPEGWSSKLFKWVFSFEKGLNITKENLVDEGISVISYGQIHSKTNTGTGINSTLIRFVPEKYLKRNKKSLVHKNDFIFADTSEDLAGVGNCVFVDEDKTIFAGYHSIIARPVIANIFPKYFAYLFLSDAWRSQLRSYANGVKVYSITQKLLGDSDVIIPSQSEQTAIAAFLDKKCALVDSIANDIERQIEILKQYKQSLITETVTKGLDKNVKMKDSGVEWSGEIPEGWEATKIKYFCTMFSGNNITSEDISDDEIYPVYGGNGLRGYYSHYTNDGEYVLIGRQGALCGNIHFVQGKFWATDHAVVTYVKDNIFTRYLYYLFGIMNFNQYSQSAAQPGLAVNTILNLETYIPTSVHEQKSIAAYLDSRCSKIDAVITDKQTQLDTLKKHKQSLIYEYVTGKKRVPITNEAET